MSSQLRLVTAGHKSNLSADVLETAGAGLDKIISKHNQKNYQKAIPVVAVPEQRAPSHRMG